MDGIDDLLDQLMQALDLQDPKLRKKLREGLEHGFEQVDVTREMHFSFDIDGDGASQGPDVTVLDGGRSDAGPRTGDRPDLEVVPDADDDGPDPEVSVRVIRARREQGGRLLEGSIDVDGQQTVFRGMEPLLYRLHCDQGAFQAVVDGIAVEALQAGQSLDVEASLIQVRGQGAGRFTRVK